MRSWNEPSPPTANDSSFRRSRSPHIGPRSRTRRPPFCHGIRTTGPGNSTPASTKPIGAGSGYRPGSWPPTTSFGRWRYASSTFSASSGQRHGTIPPADVSARSSRISSCVRPTSCTMPDAIMCGMRGPILGAWCWAPSRCDSRDRSLLNRIGAPNAVVEHGGAVTGPFSPRGDRQA